MEIELEPAINAIRAEKEKTKPSRAAKIFGARSIYFGLSFIEDLISFAKNLIGLSLTFKKARIK